MVDLPNPAGRVMHGFDGVTVRIENERAVVLGRVLRPRPRLTIALVARTRHPVPPRVDRLAVFGAEGDVQALGQRMLGRDRFDAEIAPGDVLAIAGWRPERLEVEAAARRQIGDMDVGVVEHGPADHYE
jgi:hypothetical protein